MNGNAIGSHVIFDAVVDGKWLTEMDCDGWHAVLHNLADAHGLKVVSSWEHDFGAPGAVSVGLVLGTSHASVHTWPEHNYVAIDLFSCNPALDITEDSVLRALRLPTRSVTCSVLRRAVPTAS